MGHSPHSENERPHLQGDSLQSSAPAASAHTPGPWRIRINAGRATAIADKAPGEYRSGYQYKVVADCGTAPHYESNARLIAAAPDLLAALQALTEASEPEELMDDESEIWQRAHAAIARATGATS